MSSCKLKGHLVRRSGGVWGGFVRQWYGWKRHVAIKEYLIVTVCIASAELFLLTLNKN